MSEQAERLEAIREAVAAAMRRLVGDGTLPLYEMIRYHLGFLDVEGRPAHGAGKALRPIFCCLACQAAGGDWRRAVPVAAAIELTHQFSLVHDDIEDGDRERRHRPTVWARWGIPQAINTGDAVWVLAWQALASAGEDGLPSSAVVECLRRLSRACREMIEGQYLDLALEGSAEPDLEQYLQIVTGKTAALLACAFELGAVAAGAQIPVIEQYLQAGRLLGLAFQMEDDILGVWGDPALTGKPAGSDIRRKKLALPVVCALARLKGSALNELRGLYRCAEELDEPKVERVLQLFDEVEARAVAERLARDYGVRARAAASHLPMEAASGASLLALADSLVDRVR